MLMAAQDQALRTNKMKSKTTQVFKPYVDCLKKERNNQSCGCY